MEEDLFEEIFTIFNMGSSCFYFFFFFFQINEKRKVWNHVDVSNFYFSLIALIKYEN